MGDVAAASGEGRYRERLRLFVRGCRSRAARRVCGRYNVEGMSWYKLVV